MQNKAPTKKQKQNTKNKKNKNLKMICCYLSPKFLAKESKRMKYRLKGDMRKSLLEYFIEWLEDTVRIKIVLSFSKLKTFLNLPADCHCRKGQKKKKRKNNEKIQKKF